MIAIQFLAEWALRSSILILSGALLLWALRVKDSSVRLAAWTAMLCGSLAIPVLSTALPKAPVAVMHTTAQPVETAVLNYVFAAQPAPERPRHKMDVSKPFDWALAAVTIYAIVALALLLRLCIGLAMSQRLRCGSRAIDRATDEIEIRESDRVASPLALGILRPVIMLPGDWREWDGRKLDAVLAHERSHIQRYDPAVQLISAIHRALLWHSPLSWLLHRRIVRVAEEVSDDAAVAAVCDRASYAEVLLDFMRRGVRGARWQGVPMARYGAPAERIHRILDGAALSRGLTRWSIAALLALGAPLAYLVAAAQLQRAQTLPVPAPLAPVAAQSPTVPAAPVQRPTRAAPVNVASVPAAPPQTTTPDLNYASGADGYLLHRGTTDRDVAAFMTLGGIPLQEKSFEIRKRIRNFVLFRRQENTYLIEDPDTVSRAWRLQEDQSACRVSVEAATPLVDELKKALAGCKISDAEIVAARKLKETLKSAMERQSAIEIITDSRLWSVLDLSISNGAAHPLEF